MIMTEQETDEKILNDNGCRIIDCDDCFYCGYSDENYCSIKFLDEDSTAVSASYRYVLSKKKLERMREILK